MEPRLIERSGNRAPLAMWDTDTPNTPLSEYKTPQNSPLILHKTNVRISPNTSRKGQSSQYQPLPEVEGVKFASPADCDADSICESASSDDEDDDQPVYPDGGYGWVVVGCSFVISMVADGISFSLGLMLDAFSTQFGDSKAKTAWIGGLFMAVPLLSGPIMSAFVDRYGCRVCTIFGGLISGTGFVLAIFGNNVEYELVTFGVIAGMGLGLCYVTAVVSVCQWFEKKRATANGLGACGTGIGTSVFAPMTQFFLVEYGWRGTTLLLSGTFFNMCVCGALMRDPEYILVQRERRAESIATKSIRNASSCGSISGTESQFPGSDEIRNMLKKGQRPEHILASLAEGIRLAEVCQKDSPQVRAFHSTADLPKFTRNTDNGRKGMVCDQGLISCRSSSDQGKLNQVGLINNVLLKRHQDKQFTKEDSLESPLATAQPLLPYIDDAPTVVISGLDQTKAFLQRKFSFKKRPRSNYLKNIRVHRNSMMYRAATLTTGRYHLKASSCPNIFRNSMTTLAKEQEEKWYTEILEMFKTNFNFSFFLEFHFFIMSIAIILLFIFFIVPYYYLDSLMMDNGYEEGDGATVLAYIGAVNAIGMVSFGWIGDQPWVNVAKLYAVNMVVCGISCIVAPLVVTNYWALNVTVWCFALSFASSYSLTPPLIVELIPVEKFTTAYGLVLLCQGIGNLVGPSLAGFLYDTSGYWDSSFYLAGAGIILCGLLIAIIPYTNNFMMVGGGRLVKDRI